VISHSFIELFFTLLSFINFSNRIRASSNLLIFWYAFQYYETGTCYSKRKR